jgi:tripartite-type tricarboxylate transporter receptor subunit TctC
MEIVHVPYKGGAPMIAGLLGNEVQSALDLSTTVMPHVRSGKLKLLGIASGKRSALLPDVPTLAEQGHPVEAGTFFSIMGPAQMPPEIVRTLNREINEALALPEIREKLAALGTEVVGGTPEALADTVAKELAKWRDVVRDRNLKLE